MAILLIVFPFWQLNDKDPSSNARICRRIIVSELPKWENSKGCSISSQVIEFLALILFHVAVQDVPIGTLLFQPGSLLLWAWVAAAA